MSTRRIGVSVKEDFLERLAAKGQRLAALAELVWNALDADADTVRIHIERNPLGGIIEILVEDDGCGIPFSSAEHAFSSLGGSLKRGQQRTPRGRAIHGRSGEGRFRAFSLGASVSWTTTYAEGAALHSYSIAGHRDTLGVFEIADPEPSKARHTGTTVRVSCINGDIDTSDDRIADYVSEHFALTLLQYKTVSITVNGTLLDPGLLISRRETWSLGPFSRQDGGPPFQATLIVVEWARERDRMLHLCDEDGFYCSSRPLQYLHVQRFSFAAFLCSARIGEADRANLLDLDTLQPDLVALYGEAKQILRDYFAARTLEEAKALVDRWKEQDLYPYSGDPTTAVQEAERAVFNMMAVNVSAHNPRFADADAKTKKLTLSLIRQALEQNPASLQRIINDVIGLPAEKQNEFADLLNRTSLSGVISAARQVADRLDFLVFLEEILFEPKSKKTLKERSQLHRILAGNTWLFGEEYALSVDDQSLKQVLKAHMHLLGRTVDEDLDEVVVPGQKRGIVDLMLSRGIRHSRADELECLVIELKRPSQRVDAGVQGQITSYAMAVAGDERFRASNVRWSFWAISNEIDPVMDRLSRQGSRPVGMFYEPQPNDPTPVTIWLHPWGRVIDSCRSRLRFFKDALEHNATRADTVARLRQVYARHLQPTQQRRERGDGDDERGSKATGPGPSRGNGGRRRPKA